ncbi:hypothetical protein IFR05_012977 [Cadophora sp. M221]|nr:hypothetical protein IFR05_012977 [Cadophora sp. M221]
MSSLEIHDSDLTSARGKVVLITGAANGIGKAAAELYHLLGAKVVIGDLNETLGNDLAAKLGQNAMFQVCDVTEWFSLQKLFVAAIERFGRLDIVIANAGIPEIEDLFENSVDPTTGQLLEPKYIVLDVNMRGVLATVKLAKYFFEKQKSPGSIVMTSSTGGYVGGSYLPAYMISKHGVIGLMRAIAQNSPFRASNIRVNCVAPFMTESGFTTDDLRDQLARAGIPINAALSVARAMVYLGVHPTATGQTVYIAGDKFTELETKIRALRAEWLGHDNSGWLEPKFEVKHDSTVSYGQPVKTVL